ncbi:DUF6493 family protein [Streptoalloteichus hindustanus]|uniref:DUF6493 family protein n=1 Tax=Streptoalloteichus hindustanus TaxID=2017 RepID=UPI000936CBBA|nr:DUF6493 family protein [Streptoalloteichus hindustanus]
MDPRHAPSLWLAGAGCAIRAGTAAKWLAHREILRFWTPNSEHVAYLSHVLHDRPTPWLADLATHYADAFRPQRGTWEVAATLLRAGGVEPPRHDPLVVAWCEAVDRADWGRLRADPFLPVMAPRIFVAEGVGAALTVNAPRQAHRIARLVAAGRLPRPMLLAGCLSRFLRGGEARHLRFFTLLYRELAPTADEAADHVVSFLRLLPGAAGPVAELAAEELRRAAEGGWLSGLELREALEALLFRREKRIVRSALSWLDRAAYRPDGDDALAALPVVFGGEVNDVAARAVRIAVRHARRAGDQVRMEIAAAASTLPSELREPLVRVGFPVTRGRAAKAGAAVVVRGGGVSG